MQQELDEYLARLERVKQRGRIELIMGTMFAGKSSELIQRINILEVANKRVLKVKFSADNRFDNKMMITTHSGQNIEAIPLTHL